VSTEPATEPGVERIPTEIDKGTARIFLLLKQKLLPPRSLWGKRGVTLVFSRLRCIQQDVIDAVGRMPDVVLQSRVANYTSSILDDLLYSDRSLVEYYDKGLCIIPVDDLWIFANRIERFREQHEEFKPKHKGLIEKILETIKYHGPISVEDIDKDSEVPLYWEDTKAVGRALKVLWECGELAIHHRDGPACYYDLARRVLPKNVQKHMVKMPLQQYWDYKYIRRLNAVGLLPTVGGGDVWDNIGRSEARAASGRRLKSVGVINTVRVKDSAKHYMYLAKDVPLLQAAVELRGREDLAREVSFIAPLDNLLWDRNMIVDLFNFQYTWEASVEPVRRMYGFYVLPILFGDRFVGRMDPFCHRKEQVLEIRGLFWEEGYDPGSEPIFVNAFVASIGDFMSYLGAQQLRFDEPARPVPRPITQALKKAGIKIRR
jgi:uncharacterized protein YcaQ